MEELEQTKDEIFAWWFLYVWLFLVPPSYF